MAATALEFEKPIVELEKQIDAVDARPDIPAV